MSARSVLAAALIVSALDQVSARADAPPRDRIACAEHAPQAAARSGLPVDIVLRVMRAESGGLPRSLSPKGAMGCMQMMPATWSYLSARYRLGPDPYDARMNMIGGAMYLAELAARYGMPGALAAYNAGPGRYERYAAGRAGLPAETIAYAARIVGGAPATSAGPPAARWQEAALFIVRSGTARTSTMREANPAEAPDSVTSSPREPIPTDVAARDQAIRSPGDRKAADTMFPLRR